MNNLSAHLSQSVQTILVGRIRHGIQRHRIVDEYIATKKNAYVRAAECTKSRLDVEYVLAEKRSCLELDLVSSESLVELDTLWDDVSNSFSCIHDALNRLEEDFPTSAVDPVGIGNPFGSSPDFLGSFSSSKYTERSC
jgi:hypothetical protein